MGRRGRIAAELSGELRAKGAPEPVIAERVAIAERRPPSTPGAREDLASFEPFDRPVRDVVTPARRLPSRTDFPILIQGPPSEPVAIDVEKARSIEPPVVPGADRVSALASIAVPGIPIGAQAMPGNGRPGDRRDFFHKKILGFVGGLGIPVVSQIAGGLKQILPGNGGARAPARAPLPVLPSQLQQLGGGAPQQPSCGTGFQWDGSRCVPLRGAPTTGIRGAAQRVLPFGETGFQAFGEAVMGQYGAAMEPGIRTTDVRVCPRGAVLGTDGFCYNRRDLRNKERFWPRGRRPLLTGGEMRAISTASAAAKKMQRKQKQLEQLGMLKKPARRAAPRALAPGHHAHLEHT